MKKFYKKMKCAVAFAALLLATCATAFGQCNPITITSGNPFMEDFESYTAQSSYSTAGIMPTCWDRIATGTASYAPKVYSGSSYNPTGTNCLLFISGSGSDYGSTNIAILPEFTNDLLNYVLTFDYRMENASYGTLSVGYVTSVTNVNSFTAIQTMTSYNTGTPGEVILPSIPAGARLAFRWYYNSTWYCCGIDNIVITTPPTCPKPTDLTASNITTNSVDLSWTSTATAWEVLLNGTETVSASTNPFTLTNLQPSSTYSIRVRSFCGDSDTSAWSNAISVNTACGIVTITTEQPFYQDFNSQTATSYSTAGTLPNCWNSIYTGSSAGYAPHVCTSNSYVPVEGSQALSITAYNSSSYGPRTYVILPEISNPLNTLQISFVHSNYSSTNANKLAVGYMTSTTDTTTFVKLADVPHVYYSTNRYNEFEYDITAQNIPAGARLALRAANSQSTTDYIFVDNVQVRIQPTCLKPIDVAASGIMPNSATISWTARTGETAWEIECNGIVTQVTENPYTLTNLTDNAAQHIRVRAVCSATDQSDWSSMLTFNTPCSAITITNSTPYTENFDSYTATSYSTAGPLPSCWENNYSGTSTGYAPHVCTSNSYVPQANSQAFFMHAYNNTSYGSNSYAVLPLFTNALNTLQVTFAYSHYSSSAYAHTSLGYMTNPSDGSTFVELVELPHAYYSTQRYNEFEYIILTAGIPAGARLAFRHKNTTTNNDYFFLDSLTVGIQPTCLKPTNIQATNVTGYSADLSWDANSGESSWEISLNGQLIPATSNPFTLTNLTPNTVYHVAVRAFCSATDTSGWSNEMMFQTPCAPTTITTTEPYFDNFSTYTPVTGQSHTTPGEIPDCWEVIYTGTTASYSPAVYVGSFAVSGDTCFAIVSGSGTTYGYTNYAVMPAFTNPLTDLQLEFGVTMEASAGTLYVGYITDMDTNNFVSLVSMGAPAPSNGADYYEIPFSIYASSIPANARIAFKYGDLSSSYRTCALYDVRVRIAPTCLRPTNVTASNIMPNSATISWTAPTGETAWEIECNGIVTQVNENPYTLTNLTDNTVQHIRVRAVCSATDSSEWSMPVTFATPCADKTITVANPYIEDFTGYSTTTSYSTFTEQPFCWDFYFNGSSSGYAPHVYNGSYAPNDNDNALVMTAGSSTYGNPAIAILPNITNNLNTLQVLFKYKMENASYGQLYFGYITNINNASTFTALDTIAGTTVALFRMLNMDQYAAIPAGARLAFKWEYASLWYSVALDDICVRLIPTCREVSNITVSQITSSSARIAWTVLDTTQNQWEISFNDTSVIANSNPFVLTGLTENTDYTVNVRAICGTDDLSYWNMNSHEFTTLCNPITLTDSTVYFDNFENYTNSTSLSDVNADLPDCWDSYFNGTTDGYAPHVYSSSSYAPNNGKVLVMVTSTSTVCDTNVYAVLPAFTNALEDLELDFDAAVYSSSYHVLSLGYMTDASVASTFVELEQLAPNTYSQGYTSYEIYVAQYNQTIPAGARLAFRWHANYSSTYYAFIDNVRVRIAPTCIRPQGVQVTSVGMNDVTIDWTPVGDETQWEVMAGNVDTIVTAHPVTIAGLAAATHFNVAVRAICDVNDQSDWTDSLDFMTLCDAITITREDSYLEDFQNYETTTSYSTFSEQPDCWDFIFTGTTSGYAPHVYNGSYSPTGTNSLVMTSGSSTYGSDNIAILPLFSNALNTLEVSFKVKMESASSGTLYAGYLTNAVDASTFVSLGTVPSSTTSATHTYALNEYNFPANARLAFKWSYNTSCYCVAIDDINVYLGCETPTNVTVDQYGTVRWESDAAAWTLRYVVNGDTTDVHPGNPIYTITNLPENANVSVMVQANCDATHSSPWSDPVSYNTTPCDVPTNIALDAQGNITWTSDAASFHLNYSVNGTAHSETVTTNSFHIEGLQSGDVVEIRVQAVCGESNTSAWSDPYTTTYTGIEGYTMEALNIFPNPTTGIVTVSCSLNHGELQVYDVYGKMLTSKNIETENVEIDLSSYANGVYMLRMVDNGAIRGTARIVKQ